MSGSFVQNPGFQHPARPVNPIGLSDLEQQAKDFGADVSIYIALMNNDTSHEDAIVQAGGTIKK